MPASASAQKGDARETGDRRARPTGRARRRLAETNDAIGGWPDRMSDAHAGQGSCCRVRES